VNLFVANFCDDIKEEDLERLFGRYGKVTTVRIWIDFETGKSKGYGLVGIEDDWEAERAIEKLDGKRWHGMNLTVCKARTQR
jgi:RNA recognition motif-containing protein